MSVSLTSGGVFPQGLPEGQVITASPAYFALVKSMREDERLLLVLKREIEHGKHAYNLRCLDNLRPSLISRTVAWALQFSLDAAEADEATRFFQGAVGRKVADALVLDERERPELERFAATSAGNKLLVQRITTQPSVLTSVRGEVLFLLNTCTSTLQGERQFAYCISGGAPSPDGKCTAQYRIIGRTGQEARVTQVHAYCELAKSQLYSIVAEIPGPQDTLGFHWRENRVLEVVLPPAAKPLYREVAAHKDGPRYEYRARQPGDPPAMPCIPTEPLDEFGWPEGT